MEAFTIRPLPIIPANRQFTFRGLCPYCGGDLTYTAVGWQQEDDFTWTATSLSSACSNEPSLLSDEFDDWMDNHCQMPYVYQLPVDQAVEDYIRLKYRFDMNT
jgi:hypothetical protein